MDTTILDSDYPIKMTSPHASEVNAILQSKGFVLRSGTAIEAMLIVAPSSTKKDGGSRDP
jgi:IS5 family transposase